LFIHGKLEILKEIAIAKKELPKFHRTWIFFTPTVDMRLIDAYGYLLKKQCKQPTLT